MREKQNKINEKTNRPTKRCTKNGEFFDKENKCDIIKDSWGEVFVAVRIDRKRDVSRE